MNNFRLADIYPSVDWSHPPIGLPDFFRSVPKHLALVRLENTPVFAIYWYYLLHQDMWCPSFVVNRRHLTFFDTRIVVRGLKVDFGEWRGISGSTGVREYSSNLYLGYQAYGNRGIIYSDGA